MGTSKIEDYYMGKDHPNFLKELGHFISFLIKKYVGDLEQSQFEELKDALLFRVYSTLSMRPYKKGRSDFRSYVYSITRNGISSFLHRRNREILSDEVRSTSLDDGFETVCFKYPGFHPMFMRKYPEINQIMKSQLNALIEEGYFNSQVWESMSMDCKNYSRVLLWNLFVRNNGDGTVQSSL